jgi:hypothetical protein
MADATGGSSMPIIAPLIAATIGTVGGVFAGQQQERLAKKQAEMQKKQIAADAEAQRRRYTIIGASVVGIGAVVLAGVLIYSSSKRK